MANSRIYSLEEFMQMNGIQGHFGSALGCFTADRETLSSIILPGTIPSFYTIIIMADGTESYSINNNKVELGKYDLFVKLPYDALFLDSCSATVSSLHLLIEKNFSDELVDQNDQLPSADYLNIFSTLPVFHLDDTKASEFYELFNQIQKTIARPHLYKSDLLRYQLHFCQLLLAELVTGINVETHDMKHKDNILKIFLHLASQHFRRERQIQFYADRLNISPAYLSRTIKELTGNTVLGYLNNFLYNEICIQLKTTDKSINEIAFDLNFNDQSALTNFFRTKSGSSPLTYRKTAEKQQNN